MTFKHRKRESNKINAVMTKKYDLENESRNNMKKILSSILSITLLFVAPHAHA